MGKGASKQRDVIEYETTTDEGFTKTLKKDLQVLIAYASGADVVLQREVDSHRDRHALEVPPRHALQAPASDHEAAHLDDVVLDRDERQAGRAEHRHVHRAS